ncbi:MAG: hypothetical protein RI580_12960 [Halothece sp. Uz-M2-17]|nr:hypothetical protein [Halothece sp. Uz-M2-17]
MNMSELSINIGIDWGTSFTKICVRAEDTEKSEVVIFEDPTLEGALLLSKIGILNNGELLGGLTKKEWKKYQSKDIVEVDFLKMRLANADLPQDNHLFEFTALQNYQNYDLNSSTNLENLGAYYLSQVILRVKSWFCNRYHDRIKNQELEWSANVGVPVQYCDSPAKDCFKRVLHLGWLLAEQPNLQSLTFTELEKTTKKLKSSINNEIPCFAVPEVAAGTYFYATSQEAREGNYLYADIGSGTTELCSFYYRREEGLPQISAIKAYTPPVGIDAIANGVASECGLEFSEIQHKLNGNSMSLLAEINELINTFGTKPQQEEFIASWYISQEAIERNKNKYYDYKRMLLELILWKQAIHIIIAKRPPRTKIFLGGGGRNSKFYRDAIESTYITFKQYTNPERYSPIELENINIQESPEHFTMNGIKSEHSHRFAIAFGLSIPNFEMPDFDLPSQKKAPPISSSPNKSVNKIIQSYRHLNLDHIPTGGYPGK